MHFFIIYRFVTFARFRFDRFSSLAPQASGETTGTVGPPWDVWVQRLSELPLVHYRVRAPFRGGVPREGPSCFKVNGQHVSE